LTVPALMLIGFIVSLFISVMFSGAELAIGPISRDSFEKLADNKVRGVSLILGMIENKRRFLLMLLSGKILSVVGGTVLLYSFFFIERSKWEWGLSNNLIILLTVVLSVPAYIITESIFAKLVSIGKYESRVSRFAYFLFMFHIILFPVTLLIDNILSILIKESLELAEKEEAFIELVKSESESGVIEQEEQEMIQSIFEFYETAVREVMVPRIDMVAAEKNLTIEKLLDLFEKEGHSRIPVYDGGVDNISGVIYAKDLLTYISEKDKGDFSITEIMREAYFVPENKKTSELLKEFKKNKVHIAIVVDEYGGTAGIVALEDLLEEIVGEIQDEYDEDVRDYVWINDRTLVIDAGFDIDDVNEIIRTDIPNDDFDTLGGFIYNQLGFIPEGGEEVKWGDITFKIKEINKNRISKVLVKLLEPSMKDEKIEE